METPDQSDVGYPEEQPEEVAPDEAGGATPTPPQEQGGDPGSAADRAPDNDDGTATGGG